MKTVAKPSIAGLGNGLYPAVRTIVLDALAGGVDSTLPTNEDYRERFGFATGTLQRAIDLLKERGALGIQSRGKLGRQISSIDLGQCWQAAGLSPIHLSLPPQGRVEVDALSDYIVESLGDLGVPYTVRPFHGGRIRLASVVDGTSDITVVSSATLARSGLAYLLDAQHCVTLGSRSYYGPGRLVVIRRVGDVEEPRRIAYDPESLDQTVFTKAEFPQDGPYEYVHLVFPQTLAFLVAGRVDAAVWHVLRSPIPPALAGVTMEPMQGERLPTDEDDPTRAVVVISPRRRELLSVLRHLDFGPVAERQRAAISAEDAAQAAMLEGLGKR